MLPAGGRVLALALAISSGRGPIVKINEADWVFEVTDTGLSPLKAVVGVHDQLPELSAVAVSDCEPTVPVTSAWAVVIPEKVGDADVTQNCLAPWIKVAPPIDEINPDPAKTVVGYK